MAYLPCSYRKPKLPVEMEFGKLTEKPTEDGDNLQNVSWDPEELLQYAAKMGELRKNIYDKAKRNIDAAQKKDKFYYDQKHSDPRVCRFTLSKILPKLYA